MTQPPPDLEDMTTITITTRRPEKWELIDHDENKHWVIKDGSWWQLYGPFETKDAMK